MKPTFDTSPPRLVWIVVLLLSVGLNVYLVLAYHVGAQPATSATAPATRLVSSLSDDDEDDSTEEDDTSWMALSEELRQTRRQLAECQGSHAATAKHHLVNQ